MSKFNRDCPSVFFNIDGEKHFNMMYPSFCRNLSVVMYRKFRNVHHSLPSIYREKMYSLIYPIILPLNTTCKRLDIFNRAQKCQLLCKQCFRKPTSELAYLQLLYLPTASVFDGKEMCVDENIAGYLKNHWTKHRLACTLSDAFV